jgi:hypothetical protein
MWLAGCKVRERVPFTGELPRNAVGKMRKNLLRPARAKLYTGRA